MAASGIHETADLSRFICSHGGVVGGFKGIGALTVPGSIANGDGSVAPAIAQKATGTFVLVAILAHGHSESAKVKTSNGNVLLVRSLNNAADKAADLGNLAAGAITGCDRSADLEARDIEYRAIIARIRGKIAHIADGAANANIAVKRFSCSDGRLSLAVIPKRNRGSCRHAACNATNVRIVGDRIIARDIRFARCARQRQTTRNGARKRSGINGRAVIELHRAGDGDVGDSCAVDCCEQAQAAVAVDFAVAGTGVVGTNLAIAAHAIGLAHCQAYGVAVAVERAGEAVVVLINAVNNTGNPVFGKAGKTCAGKVDVCRECDVRRRNLGGEIAIRNALHGGEVPARLPGDRQLCEIVDACQRKGIASFYKVRVKVPPVRFVDGDEAFAQLATQANDLTVAVDVINLDLSDGALVLPFRGITRGDAAVASAAGGKDQ